MNTATAFPTSPAQRIDIARLGAPTFSASSPEELRSPVLGRTGDLELIAGRRPKDIRRAQRLRYKVFFEEMSAAPDTMARLARRDVDIFDEVCDHLILRDRGPREGHAWGKPRTIGTCRLLRQEAAEASFGFETQNAFDIAPLVARHRHLNFLELGRSCVLAPRHDRRTVELLWQGIWAYITAHRAEVMIGCVSLAGANPAELALPFSYLHHFHRAPHVWRASALEDRRADIPLLPREAIDAKAALRALPPLIKVFLRIGAMIGDGAVTDRKLGTTDILVVLPRAFVNPRYIQPCGHGAARHAA